jgi:hypothetical protein
MTLGQAGVTGEGPDTFNDPTGVVIGKNGDIFVSDGHVGRNQSVARIVKFAKNGKFLKTWGKKGSDPVTLTIHIRLPWTRKAGSSSQTAEISASGFSIKMEI